MSGTHGKTTTTAMIVHALRACGMDPAFVVGGEIRAGEGPLVNAGWADDVDVASELDADNIVPVLDRNAFRGTR